MSYEPQQPPEIGSKAQLLAQALIMLDEMAERYEMYADQMEVANNPEAAALFTWLTQKQSQRSVLVNKLSAGLDLPHIKPWHYNWDDAVNLETADRHVAHYLMQPYQVLALAIHVEETAIAFFNEIAATTTDPEVAQIAIEIAKDAHVFAAVLQQKQQQYPEPEAGWDEDPDPPLQQE